jgi:GntR family transcriptional regulator
MPGPLYRTIAEALRQRIESASADLHPGDQLPNEQDLGEQYSASRNTIREAIRWLINRGLVEARPGQGTFVSEKFDPFVTTLSGDWQSEGMGLSGGEGNSALQEARDREKSPVTSEPQVTPQFAEDVVARLLQVPEGTGVIVRQQRRFLDDTPWSVLTSYYPMRYIDQGAQLLRAKSDIEEGAVAYLKKELGITQIGYRDQVIVRAPEDDEARFFNLPDSGRVPVVVIYRTGFAKNTDGSPAPFRLTVTVFPADRNQFVINAGEIGSRLAEPIVPRLPNL